MTYPATGNVYKVGDLITKYTETGLPIFKILYKQFKTLSYLTFDVEEMLMQDGKTMLMFKFRNLPGIEHTISETGISLKYREYAWRVFETTATGDQPAVTNFVADDVLNFNVNDVILIYCDDGVNPVIEEQRRITSIVVGTHTLVLDAPIANVYNGNRILRLFNVRNDGDDILNTYNLQGAKEMEVFYQNFQGEINFTTAQLNKTYQYPEGPENYVSSIFSNFLQHQIHEYGFAFWRGRNLAPTASQKSEMLGIFPAIEETMAVTGLSLRRDLSGLTSDDDQVRAIIDEIYEAQMSGLVDEGQPLTIVSNNAALRALTKLNGAWNKLAGVTVFDDTGTDVKLNVRKVVGQFGTIEFMADHFMNILYPKKAMMIIIPRNLISMRMRVNETVNVDGSAPTFNKYVPGLQFTDISKIVNARKPEISTFIAHTHFATVFVGLATGAWRIIEGVH